jgi:hypothetical protein
VRLYVSQQGEKGKRQVRERLAQTWGKPVGLFIPPLVDKGKQLAFPILDFSEHSCTVPAITS